MERDVWNIDVGPFMMWRFYDQQPTKDQRDEHLSFLRKTCRLHKHAYILKIDDYGSRDDSKIIGELFFGVHEDRDDALKWGRVDPYTEYGVFPECRSDQTFRYCNLDGTGTQKTYIEPLNKFPDPLAYRIVQGDYVNLTERVVQRLQVDPTTGKFTLFNITTLDPRFKSNVIEAESLDPASQFRVNEDDAYRFYDDEDEDDLSSGLTTLDAAPDLYPTEIMDDYGE